MTKSTQIDYEKLVQWEEAQKQLAYWKEMESTLRDEIAEEFFPESKIGTNNFKLQNKYVLKMVRKINKRVDEEVLQSVIPELSPGVEDIAIKYKPTVVAAAMKMIKEKDRELINMAITTTEAKPTLKIVQAKR